MVCKGSSFAPNLHRSSTTTSFHQHSNLKTKQGDDSIYLNQGKANAFGRQSMKNIKRTLPAMFAFALGIICLNACEPESPPAQVTQELQTEIQDSHPVAKHPPLSPSDGLAAQRDCRWYTQSSFDTKMVKSYCPLRSRVVTGGCRTQFSYISRSAPFVGSERQAPKDGEHWSAVGDRGTWTGWNCARPDQDGGELIAMALCCEYY